MLSHLILQLDSIDGPEKVRRHLSIRGGAHVTSVSHSPESVYSITDLTSLLSNYHTRQYLLGSWPAEPPERAVTLPHSMQSSTWPLASPGLTKKLSGCSGRSSSLSSSS